MDLRGENSGCEGAVMTAAGDRARFLAVFIILFALWLLLSWHFDFQHVFLGLVCSLLVAYSSNDLLITRKQINISPRKIILFISYLFYLAYSIVLANLDVAYRVLHPKMPIEPRVVEFESRLKSDIGRTVLANSITLTPGTITIDIRNGIFYVHALSDKSAEELLKGEMEDKLVEIFE